MRKGFVVTPLARSSTEISAARSVTSAVSVHGGLRDPHRPKHAGEGGGCSGEAPGPLVSGGAPGVDQRVTVWLLQGGGNTHEEEKKS